MTDSDGCWSKEWDTFFIHGWSLANGKVEMAQVRATPASTVLLFCSLSLPQPHPSLWQPWVLSVALTRLPFLVSGFYSEISLLVTALRVCAHTAQISMVSISSFHHLSACFGHCENICLLTMNYWVYKSKLKWNYDQRDFKYFLNNAREIAHTTSLAVSLLTIGGAREKGEAFPWKFQHFYFWLTIGWRSITPPMSWGELAQWEGWNLLQTHCAWCRTGCVPSYRLSSTLIKSLRCRVLPSFFN